MFEEVGELDALFAPLGGGGLLSGSALSAKAMAPKCKIYGVEPEAGNDAQPAPPPPEKQLAGFKSLLTVTSAPPFAEVIVDGRFIGTTPVKDKELPAGKHKIQVSHRSFPPIDTVVNLGPGEKVLRFRLFK